jgi:hypothetical protein
VQDAKRGVKGDPDPLPLAQYVSLIGTHTLLLLFCMILMPRSTSLFMELPPQASSQDRPQAEWMAPVTVLPSWSVGWMCVGAAAVQTFWARRLRTWVMSDEGNAEGNLDEARRGMKVYIYSSLSSLLILKCSKGCLESVGYNIAWCWSIPSNNRYSWCTLDDVRRVLTFQELNLLTTMQSHPPHVPPGASHLHPFGVHPGQESHLSPSIRVPIRVISKGHGATRQMVSHFRPLYVRLTANL